MFNFLKSKKASSEVLNKAMLLVVGFNKTGTTSIHRLAQKSGYNSVHWDEGKIAKRILYNAANNIPLLSGYHDSYQVYSDMAFRCGNFRFDANSLFMQLDHDYPNAKFLYNYRDIDAWLESRINHGEVVDGETNIQYYRRLFGTSNDLKIKNFWRNERLRYEDDIRAYFDGTNKLIELNIEDNKFVDKLNNFSGFNFKIDAWGQHNQT
ncbi:hypothetical protein DRW07_12970 [Alteromonas sediminis]|uniref:Sulfotransferase family protein n=1 Tax=Alteromonas sediminis TaxID=2259342 RepID=A0A3N5XZ06_9ALTE|nr:sulfotransferase [Alteromonas sediminis]RPJ65723.1 hypothetical protein DRW07_12970 [Alteromonas sediminis]